MLHGGVVGLVRRLDAALGHHGVGVADAQLGHDHHICPGLVGLDGCRGSGPAAADDQHIHVIVDLVQVDVPIQQAAVGVQQVGQLTGGLLALIRPDFDLLEAVRAIVGMIGFQQRILFIRIHPAGLRAHALWAGGLHLLDGFQHRFCKHGSPSLLFYVPMVV